jgi:hypothetical protein
MVISSKGKTRMSLSIAKVIPSPRVLAVAGIVSMLGVSSALAAEGPFNDFGGNWRGAGRIFDTHGRSEAMSCKSSNAPSSDGVAMQLSLVCASDSYRVDFHSDLYTDGQALRGTWTETTRSATGNVAGTITHDEIRAAATAPGFNANVVIRAVGSKRLDVALTSTGTSIDRVQVSMRR